LARGIEKARPKYARWTWIVRLWFARLTAWLLLLVLLAGFVLSDYWIMTHYFEAKHPDFWSYFGVSVALPGLFFLWQLVRLIRFERSVRSGYSG
jgi:ABC-type Fe3+ transport system permease subunit